MFGLRVKHKNAPDKTFRWDHFSNGQKIKFQTINEAYQFLQEKNLMNLDIVVSEIIEE